MRHSLPFSEWLTEVTLAIRPHLKPRQSLEMDRRTRDLLAEDWANGRAPEDVAAAIGEGRHLGIALTHQPSVHHPDPIAR